MPESRNLKAHCYESGCSRRNFVKGAGLAVFGLSAMVNPKVDRCGVAASYVVFSDRGTTYARNGRTGKIDYKGKDCAKVIQSALNSLTDGRTWKEKVVLKGNFVIDKTILVPSYTILEIHGRIRQADNANLEALVANQHWKGWKGTNTHIDIVGGIFDSNYANQKGYVRGERFEGACLAFYNVDHCSFDKIRGMNFGHYGVLVLHGFDNYVGAIYGENGIGRNGYSGVLFITGGTLTAHGRPNERSHNIIVDAVFGRNIKGPGLFLEDYGSKYSIGLVHVINDEIEPSASGVAIASAHDVSINSIYAEKCGRGLAFDGQNRDSSKNYNFGQIIALDCYYDGVYIISTGATSHKRVYMNIGRIISKNNGRGQVESGGLTVGKYVSNVYIGELIATDDRDEGKTQHHGIFLHGNNDKIVVSGGDVSGNKESAVKIEKGVTNLRLRNLFGYVTQNGGVGKGPSPIIVEHGLADVPTSVQLTPKGSKPIRVSYEADERRIKIYHDADFAEVSWYARL